MRNSEIRLFEDLKFETYLETQTMNDSIAPLSIQLKELPKTVELLPSNIIEQLVTSHDLLKGMIKQLPEYSAHTTTIHGRLEEQISRLNGVIDMFNEYQQTSIDIGELIMNITKVYEEFSSLELIQYKLLSSNFNQSLLKSKYKKLIELNDQESRSKLSTLDSGNIELSLNSFRSSRKLYHLRKEKLNRWNEDRVSGFI